MRILHVVHQYLPERVGGTELYTRDVARELAGRGHIQSIFVPAECRRDTGVSQEDGLEILRVGVGPRSAGRAFLASGWAPDLLRAFEMWVGRFQPDLVHLQHLKGLPVGILASLRRLRRPYVVTLHDYWWVCANAQLFTNDTQEICDGPRACLNCARCLLARAGQPIRPALLPVLALPLRWRNARLRQGLLAANRLIAPSRFARDWYAAHGIPAARIEVWPHGIAVSSRLPLAPRRDGPVRFVYIGGLSRQKGVHTVLAAFARLTGGAELWIGGDLTAEPEYAAQLQASAAPGVRFLGRLSREAVWETLAQADVLVMPSLWYESFSLIVREAFAAGIPAVVSDLGALAEAVRDGVDGLRVPAGDVEAWRRTLQRLVDDPALRRALRAGVRPPLSLTAYGAQLEALYREILTTG